MTGSNDELLFDGVAGGGVALFRCVLMRRLVASYDAQTGSGGESEDEMYSVGVKKAALMVYSSMHILDLNSAVDPGWAGPHLSSISTVETLHDKPHCAWTV